MLDNGRWVRTLFQSLPSPESYTENGSPRLAWVDDRRSVGYRGEEEEERLGSAFPVTG